MTFKDFEKCFKRAFVHSYNKKKIFFTIPFLLLCGVITVFCRSLIFLSNKWIILGLIFLPIFFSFIILYMLGVFLIRIYYNEVKSLKVSYFEILKKSFNSIISTFFISIPTFLIFLVLWFIFCLFVVLKEIPHIGNLIGIMITSVSFLIIFCVIFLCIFNLISLFFVLPAVTLKSMKKIELVKEVLKNFKHNIIANIMFFLSSIFLVFLISLILFSAAFLTKTYFYIHINNVYVGLQLFFIMIPFIVILTPFVVFFFNFATETYNLLQVKDR